MIAFILHHHTRYQLQVEKLFQFVQSQLCFLLPEQERSNWSRCMVLPHFEQHVRNQAAALQHLHMEHYKAQLQRRGMDKVLPGLGQH